MRNARAVNSIKDIESLNVGHEVLRDWNDPLRPYR